MWLTYYFNFKSSHPNVKSASLETTQEYSSYISLFFHNSPIQWLVKDKLTCCRNFTQTNSKLDSLLLQLNLSPGLASMPVEPAYKAYEVVYLMHELMIYILHFM